MTKKNQLIKTTKKTEYKSDFDEIIHNFALMGMRRVDIANAFGITRDMLIEWEIRHPTFRRAYETGGAIADGRVMRAIFDSAIGDVEVREVKEVQIKDKIVELTTIKTKEPNMSAAALYMRSRQLAGATFGMVEVDPDEDAASREREIDEDTIKELVPRLLDGIEDEY